MSKTRVVVCKPGDKVRISKYSELFGRHDAIEDSAMRHVVFDVADVRHVEVTEPNGDPIPGFADLELIDTCTGLRFEYMVSNTQVELVTP